MKWLRRLLSREPVWPTDVYVVLDKGVPIVAVADDAAVRRELEGRDRRLTRVHRIPFRAKESA